MGIKGTIFAIPPKSRVEHMKVGEKGYIEAYNLIVTKEAVFIDRITEVLSQQDYEDESEMYDGICVAIERIGLNLTEEDFEIDVDILEDYDFNLEGKGSFLENISEQDRYVVFNTKNFNLQIIDELRSVVKQRETEEVSLSEQLEARLKEAIDKQDFELAAKLRNEINGLSEEK